MGKLERSLGDISKKTVAIAGLGSVGSSLAETFTRLGVNLRLVDMGRIEVEDLESCHLYVHGEESKFKAKEAKKHLEKINPKQKVKSFHEKLSEANIFLLEADAIIDCTQNWEASKLINKYCKDNKIPLIYTRVAGSNGLILADKGYAHTKLEPFVEKLGTVKEGGLQPSSTDMACSIALTKALKILTGEKYSSKLFQFDTWKMSKRESQL